LLSPVDARSNGQTRYTFILLAHEARLGDPGMEYILLIFWIFFHTDLGRDDGLVLGDYTRQVSN